MKHKVMVFSLMTILIIMASSYALSVPEKTTSCILDPGEAQLVYTGKVTTRDVGKAVYVSADISGEARSWIYIRADIACTHYTFNIKNSRS